MSDAPDNGNTPTLAALRTGYALLTRRERREGLWLSISLSLAAVIDMVSILSVMPLVTLIVEPKILETSESFRQLNALIGTPPVDALILWLAAGAAVLLTVAALANLGLHYWLNSFGSRAASRLAEDMMRECLATPYSWHLRQNAAVLTRMFFGDIQKWGTDFAQRILTVAHKGLILALALAVILYAALLPGLIAIVVISALTAGLLTLARPIISRVAAEQRARSDAIVTALTQCFAGIKDIKLSSREAFFADLYASTFWVFSWTRMILAVWQQVPPTIMLFLGQVGLIAVAVALWNLDLPAGEIAASMALLVLVSARLVPALNRIAGDVTAFWNVFPYIERLAELRQSVTASLDETAPTSNKPEKLQPMAWSEIAFDRVGYAYGDGERQVLRDVCLTIERGKAYGVAGRSGAGKSTLVDLLLALLRPTSGAVLIDGEELAKSEIRRWQCGIGYVPQAPFIADDSVRANVAFGVPRAEVDDAHVWHCLELASIRDFCEGLADGLDSVLGDQGKRLSGGQRQRVAIARALYNRPPLLVLDEATSSLDPVSEDAIKQAIAGLHGQVTTLTVAHRLSTIRNSDSIFLLDEGQLTDSGRFDELHARSALFRRLAATTAVVTEAEPEERAAASAVRSSSATGA